ncbi:MAG: hypothetical protein HRT52_05745 [Colwellia sp.]|nr:hypothetical protein [Colwellia sp.]
MYKKLLIIIGFSCLFFGCTDEQSKGSQNVESDNSIENQVISTKVEDPKETQPAEKSISNKIEVEVNEQLTLAKDKKNKLAEYLKKRGGKASITLNGEKFILNSAQFGKGSKVYNKQMGEYGLIKGTIVVVGIDKVSADELLYPLVKVIQIAKNTFRLIPEKAVELMPFYKELIKSKLFSVVEMEIDYSPINESAVY